MICKWSLVEDYWSLAVCHASTLQVLELSQSITVFSALCGPLSWRSPLRLEWCLWLIWRISTANGSLSQRHRMAVTVGTSTSLYRWWPSSHQNWWIVQRGWVIAGRLCTEIWILLLLLLLDLFLNLELLELLLYELLLLLRELLSLRRWHLSLVHNAWGGTSLNTYCRRRGDLSHLLLGIVASTRDDWRLQWRGLYDLFVWYLCCRRDVRCRGCSWFLNELLCIFRREFLWFRIESCCHRLFVCALR